jgi:nuclear transport factor 2 (NTF2) superfamily protein
MSTTSLLRPPFNPETALLKVQAAEDAWNSRDPTGWCWPTRPIRNGATGPSLCGAASKSAPCWGASGPASSTPPQKELWGFRENRMAVRFEYEYHDAAGQWFRAYGNELWEFAPDGLMQRRYASINDLAIGEEQRQLR